jgi:uncharacterized ion transporter superfamily protein YfcC
MSDLKAKAWQMPDTYVIIFFVVLFAAALTWIIPVGVYTESTVVEYGEGKTKTVLVRDSFTSTFTVNDDGDLVPDAGGEAVRQRADSLFEPFGGAGILNYAFEGFVSGDKWGSAVGVMAFILIVGGAFGIILKTGAVEAGILSVIQRTKGYEILIIPILFTLFSAGGALFGMGEEAIAFAMLIIPIVIALGYDAITGIMITYVATQIGFGTSWMNPFGTIVAAGVAETPINIGFRIAMWALFTLIGIGFTTWYAMRIKKNPEKSVSYESDGFFRDDMNSSKKLNAKFEPGHAVVLIIMTLGIIWLVWGVMAQAYYIPSIASQFFIMGLLAGIAGVVFKLNDMRINDIAISFRNGAKDLLGAAMVVGMAKGIMIILGGADFDTPNVMNTILFSISSGLQSVPAFLNGWFMYVFQSVFNFFVVSGSGQAALTMPIMAPLADAVGISRDLSVLAFQLGDGFTNLIVPTSASLMGTLAVARLDWAKWAKFQIGFQGVLFALGTLFVIFGFFVL